MFPAIEVYTRKLANPSSKILCIRLSAIGDIVMATPFIKSLRSQYPDAHIAWLVQAEASDLLTVNSALDEVIIWPRNDWKRLWSGLHWLRLLSTVHSFVKLLRSRHFDMVIDLQGLLKSGLWARLSGAPVRIGLGSTEGSAYLMTKIIDKPDNDDRIGPEYRHLARVLGLQYSEFDMEVTLTDEDIRYAARLINTHDLATGYIVICPYTTRPQKHWVESHWNLLAHRIKEHYGIKTVILGGPENLEAGEKIAAEHRGIMVNQAGHTRLRQAAAIISKASLLIGVDTGLTHMGIAFNVPTVALFGSTRPYLETEHDKVRIIYKYLECSPCGRNPTCGGAFTCMTSVTVDEVMGKVRELMQST
jgi:lipopolysaccharide heptosyltransferase I